MKKSLLEELYKFRHQHIPLYGIISLFGLMFYSFVGTSVEKIHLISGFGTMQWVPMIVIVIGSAFFAMEYRHHTIIMILYKNSSKWRIYLAKFLVILFYGIFLVMIGTLTTFILKIMVANQLSWSMPNIGGQTLLDAFLLNMLGSAIYVSFISALCFMVFMIFKNNLVVIGIGLAVGFWGSSLSTMTLESLPNLVSILRWNPLNMIMIINQFSNPIKYEKYTHLSNLSLTSANIGYTLLFILIGYWLFKKQRV